MSATTTRDRIGAWEVALDLIELGREDEAKALLDAELSDRLTVPCAACGASAGWKCNEPAMHPCARCAATGKVTAYVVDKPFTKSKIVACDHCYGTGQREIGVKRILPHESRILRIERRW
ncbi:hypothetical protein BH11MYX1_BH11MYX1_04470 [soil metagenome]